MAPQDKHKKARPANVVDSSDKQWQRFRLPKTYLDGIASVSSTQDSQGGADSPKTPLLVFINADSGGHVGEQLSEYFKEALGTSQVFELGKKCNPEDVLRHLWANFDKAIQAGDKQAEHIRLSTRLIACGGDGTIAWVLNSVRKLNMDPCPAAAVIPLGTGNGLSINFGWGKTMRANWIASNQQMLEEFKGIAEAELRDIDIWNIQFDAPDTSYYNKDEIPAALLVTEPASSGRQTEAQLGSQSSGRMGGEFCYYFTFGLDAEGAYRFDELRKTKPGLTQKRKINIFWYMWFIIRTGWFCGASPLNEKIARLQAKDKNGQWIDVKVADSIRALIIINLQTYSGGRDVWGLKDERPEEGVEKGFVDPIFDDGLLEVVGLEGGFKSWAALSGIRHDLHGRRVAQANELRITYHSPKEKKGVAMRMDGEPWWQPLPNKPAEELVVHIKHSGMARMLLNTARLPGVTKKLKSVAEREKTFSHPSQ